MAGSCNGNCLGGVETTLASLALILMETKPVPLCNQHKKAKEWRQVTFEYNEGGISVRVPGIYAWVCPVDEEASFTPETFDELLTTVRPLLVPAKEARAR